MNRNELREFIQLTYNCTSDFPWVKYPEYEVFRHSASKKWFALVAVIPREKLGLPDDGNITVVNLKCDPILIGSLRREPGFFPAYHMNKEQWVTAALDGTVPDETLKMLLDMSFDLTNLKEKRQKKGKTWH